MHTAPGGTARMLQSFIGKDGKEIGFPGSSISSANVCRLIELFDVRIDLMF